MTEQVKHLLGGYATGTLTPEENNALMQAALGDQEIFDAMADDEALRRYLAEPSFRQDLLKATAPRTSFKRWAGVAGGVAAAACLVTAYLWVSRPVPVALPVQMAASRPVLRREPAPAPAPAVPAKSPKAKVLPRRAEALASTAKSAAPEPKVPPAAEALSRQIQSDGMVANGSLPPPSFAPRSVNSAERLLAPRPAASTFTAHVTDINAMILTLDAGSNAGVRVGDHLEILHESSVVGEVIITSAEPAFSVGRYTGITPPQIGDTAALPKK